MLDAGTYTIEATTYSSGKTGYFTLTVSGLSSPTPTPTPTPTCAVATIHGDVVLSGSWSSASCPSANRPGRYARYYSFTLDSTSQVQIDLTSDEDTYLFLLSGSGENGSVLFRDDDGGSGTNSQIRETLSRGTYTIEATTYSSGRTGSFTLTVSGLSAPSPTPTPAPTITPTPNHCAVNSIISDVTIQGAWSAGCDSTHRSGRYARYYSFTLDSTSQVQIDLTSDEDTYLFLLVGLGHFAPVLYEDDDGGYRANSRILETLPAGTYTIEATTYSFRRTGSFTLTVSGL